MTDDDKLKNLISRWGRGEIDDATFKSESKIIGRPYNEEKAFMERHTTYVAIGKENKGAAITCDYPHHKGAVGLFHTHPIPEPPSSRDFVSTINADHTIMCVGTQQNQENIVSCFNLVRNDIYYSIRMKSNEINTIGAVFEQELQKKYGTIPERVTEFTDEEYSRYIALLDDTDDLEKEFEKNRDSLIGQQATFQV